MYRLYIILLLMAYQADLLAQKVLSKDEFLNRVSVNSAQIQLALQEQDLATSTVREARSAALPRLNAVSGLQRNLVIPQIFLEFPDFDNAFVNPNTGEFMIENRFQGFDASLRYNFQAQASLQLTLFNLKALYGIQAAAIYKSISEHEYRTTKTQLLVEAEKLYIQTALLAQVYETNLLVEKNAKENFTLAQADQENGLISTFDLYQAELSYDESLSNRLNAYANYQLALINLKQLAGIESTEDVIISFSFEVDLQENRADTCTLNQVLANRNDYQTMLLNVMLREKEVQVKGSGFVPVIESELQYSFNAQSNKFKLNENDFNALVLGVQVRWDIFTGGQRSAETQKAKVALEKANIQAKQQKKNINSTITALQLKLNAQKQQVSAAGKMKATAEKALKLAEVNASSGLISQKALREARIENRKAMLNHLNAIAAYQQTLIDWKKTTGQYNE